MHLYLHSADIKRVTVDGTCQWVPVEEEFNGVQRVITRRFSESRDGGGGEASRGLDGRSESDGHVSVMYRIGEWECTLRRRRRSRRCWKMVTYRKHEKGGLLARTG